MGKEYQGEARAESGTGLRYSPGIAAMRDDPRLGRVLGCDAYSSNAPLGPSHPDFFYCFAATRLNGWAGVPSWALARRGHVRLGRQSGAVAAGANRG